MDQMRGLAVLRARLDRIDDQILDLIERRLAASEEIAALKDSAGDRHLKLRPGRQNQILDRLKARARCADGALIDRVWREIMGHSLDRQARMELVLAPCEQPELLEARVRAHFGSAAPIRRARSAASAIRSARSGEAIAILPERPARPAGALRMFDTLAAEDGRTLGYAFGRVACDDAATESAGDVPDPSRGDESAPGGRWTPSSWRDRPAQQVVRYPDRAALARIELRLAGSEPLVDVADVIHLRAALARVANGEAFILQGGDCAESFAEFDADKVRGTYSLLLRMGAILRSCGFGDIVHLARIAGQFAKPRSSPVETLGGITLPSYRGDAVNGPAFSPAERTPDPRRLLEAHRQARVTIQLLNAFAAASYADLPQIHRDVGLDEPMRPVPMFTSHEALLLNYEQALTRFDEASGRHWATSGHMLWIGDRTRQLDGAHVEFARGIANPIGLKCGPSLEPADLMRLIDRLDPDNLPGRLVLVGRFGASRIGAHLPRLMQAVRREGRRAIWSIDPMHGNSCTVDGLKTRILSDILEEARSFFAIAGAEGVHPGGIHLEMTGSPVTECIGGSSQLARADLSRNYLTHCDPRLNQSQAIDVANAIADLIAGMSTRSRAA
jgi:3-deoxy-7-phosphoheptulonate synthase